MRGGRPGGLFWGPFGAFLGVFWGSWVLLEPFCDLLESSGPFRGPFGGLLGPFSGLLGASGLLVGAFYGALGHFGALLGPFGGLLGLFWDLEARLHTWGWGLTPLRAHCLLPVLWDCSTLPPPPLPLPWALWFPCPSLSQQHPKVTRAVLAPW